MTDLKRCPCGDIPENLVIIGNDDEKYAYVNGHCCGDWQIEFRLQYNRIDSDEAMRRATRAWNGADRAESLK